MNAFEKKHLEILENIQNEIYWIYYRIYGDSFGNPNRICVKDLFL